MCVNLQHFVTERGIVVSENNTVFNENIFFHCALLFSVFFSKVSIGSNRFPLWLLDMTTYR